MKNILLFNFFSRFADQTAPTHIF